MSGCVADAVSAGLERFRFLLDVVCLMRAIFLGRILLDGVGGGGIPPYDGRPGREDERRPVRICPFPRRICKKIHAICQKARGYTKKMETKLHIPPINGMGCEIYRFPKTKMTYEKSRCGSKSTSSLTIGTRAVRFKTQRPQYKAFCYGRALFYMLHSQPSGGVLAIYDLENHSGKGATFRKQRRSKGARPMCSTKADDTGKGSRAGRGNCVPR